MEWCGTTADSNPSKSCRQQGPPHTQYPLLLNTQRAGDTATKADTRPHVWLVGSAGGRAAEGGNRTRTTRVCSPRASTSISILREFFCCANVVYLENQRRLGGPGTHQQNHPIGGPYTSTGAAFRVFRVPRTAQPLLCVVNAGEIVIHKEPVRSNVRLLYRFMGYRSSIDRDRLHMELPHTLYEPLVT